LPQEFESSRVGGSASLLPENLEFRFRPIWHVGRKVISTFQCVPVWYNRSGGYLSGDRILGGSDESSQILEMDLRVLQEAGHALRIQHELGHTQLVSVAVHYSTLNRQRTQQSYMSALLSLPRDYRRFLVIELIGLPNGVPRGRLLDVSLSLKEYSRARIVKLSLDRLADLSIIADTNFLATGIDVYGAAGSERILMKKIEAFAKAASRHLLKTYVHGLPSLSLTTAAVCAGYDYIDGDAIASLVETPTGLAALEAEGLYMKLFAREAS